MTRIDWSKVTIEDADSVANLGDAINHEEAQDFLDEIRSVLNLASSLTDFDKDFLKACNIRW